MSKIRDSAKGEECQVRIIGVCNFNPETTVLAHSNRMAAGKGKGLKALDPLGAYACSACHALIDGGKLPPGMTRQDVELDFYHGMLRTFVILVEKGLVRF